MLPLTPNPSDILLHCRKNICINESSYKIHSQLKHWSSCTYEKTFPTTWDSKWEYIFHIIKLSTSFSAVMESTQNGKSRNVNIGDIHLVYSLDILDSENNPINTWGRKAKLLFSNELLP